MTTCRRLLLLLPLLLLATACISQERQVDRQPAVAGQFYPGSAEELRRTLDDLFAKALKRADEAQVLALVVPHAGYVFSGEVAASGFNQIDPEEDYENVFVIGSSHHMAFDGASVYSSGDFLTPLGTVKVNRRLGADLARENEVFSTRLDAHIPEHSLEVQLPFLQAHLKNSFQIVPILVGTRRPETCRRIAAALRPFLSEKNLFVISSDFSHYPAYEAAVRVDKATADAIISNSPDVLIQTLHQNEESGITGLATSLCGWSSVLTLLYMTSQERDVGYQVIQYRNSGDSPAGTRDGVVGYYAIIATRQESPARSSLGLTEEDMATLLAIARRTVEAYVTGHALAAVEPLNLSEALKTRCGAFVTLNKHEMLRGCIGRFEATDPLYKTVQEMAIASATQDIRFKPVVPGELRDIEIEISVLSPMEKISSIDKIQLGKHGIYIHKGMRSGTLLPQVAKATGWTREEFLGYCAQEKAGIGWDGWKDADLYVYEALVFSEKELPRSP